MFLMELFHIWLFLPLRFQYLIIKQHGQRSFAAETLFLSPFGSNDAKLTVFWFWIQCCFKFNKYPFSTTTLWLEKKRERKPKKCNMINTKWEKLQEWYRNEQKFESTCNLYQQSYRDAKSDTRSIYFIWKTPKTLPY